ncbi:MAG: DUF4397 domain-containing protein [bacterium]|nr:DUF4397 domain-containing protein [bacterium]
MMNLKLKSKGLMKTLGLVTMLALSVAVTGCSDDDDNPMTPMGEGAELRVVHASPDAGNVDIYAEGVAAPLLTNVPYTATSPYLELAPGQYNIQLRPAGAAASSTPVFETGMVTVPEARASRRSRPAWPVRAMLPTSCACC